MSIGFTQIDFKFKSVGPIEIASHTIGRATTALPAMSTSGRIVLAVILFLAVVFLILRRQGA